MISSFYRSHLAIPLSNVLKSRIPNNNTYWEMSRVDVRVPQDRRARILTLDNFDKNMR